MTLAAIENLARVLRDRQVRYLVVGGMAAIVQGYVRYTSDIDLVIDFESSNLQRAVHAFQELGYRPMVAVSLHDFADPEKRKQWVDDRNALVLKLVRENDPTPVDIFVQMPFNFEHEYLKRDESIWAPDVTVSTLNIDSLIDMKRDAGRAKDLIDVEHLERIRILRNTE